MKRKFKVILLCCLVSIFVITTSVNESKSYAQIIVISLAVLSSLLLAGAALTPQQKSDFYGDVYGGFIVSCQGVSGEAQKIVRRAYQVHTVTNSLGQQYLVGRAAKLTAAAGQVYDHLKAAGGAIGQVLRDILDGNPPVITPESPLPEPGDIIQGGWRVTGPSTLVQLTCMPLGQQTYILQIFTGWARYVNVPTAGANCTPPSISVGVWSVPIEPSSVPPALPLPPTWPAVPEPDYCPFANALAPYVDPASPLYSPAVVGDIDRTIPISPPGVWVPDVPDFDPDVDVPPDTIPEPQPVPINPPNDTPLPDSDNSLLRGIYNNTLATAKNTNTIEDKLAALNSSVVALPGQISPPIVGAIEALPVQISTPIVGAVNALPPAITAPIVAKLDEIKQIIPPPIDSLEIQGNGPNLNSNSYDSSVTTPDELSLTDTILNFINSGLPFVSSIKGNRLSLSGMSPRYEFSLYGHQYSFDFSPYESDLRAFGMVLYGIMVITCFAVIVRR